MKKLILIVLFINLSLCADNNEVFVSKFEKQIKRDRIKVDNKNVATTNIAKLTPAENQIKVLGNDESNSMRFWLILLFGTLIMLLNYAISGLALRAFFRNVFKIK